MLPYESKMVRFEVLKSIKRKLMAFVLCDLYRYVYV